MDLISKSRGIQLETGVDGSRIFVVYHRHESPGSDDLAISREHFFYTSHQLPADSALLAVVFGLDVVLDVVILVVTVIADLNRWTNQEPRTRSGAFNQDLGNS